jgi:hypothetical protein
MKYKYLILISVFLFFGSCDLLKSDETKALETLNEKLDTINNSFKGKDVLLEKNLFNKVLKEKKNKAYSMLIYYDANCSICYTELEKWQDLIVYFKTVDNNLNIKFILFSDDELLTKVNLENSKFPKELVVFDKRNSFLNDYRHLINKPYNTTLLDENNKIVFVGSPLQSENLKKHYTELIKKNI